MNLQELFDKLDADLDKLEALARAALDVRAIFGKDGEPQEDPRWTAYDKAINPAVVLQWIAETRAKDAAIDELSEAVNGTMLNYEQLLSEEKTECVRLRAKLRVAVEALPSTMLAEFHRIFSPNESYDNADNRALRISLLREEFEEYLVGERTNDLVEIADALADMVYIIYGTALVYKIPLDEILTEVHRSNLSKLGDDGKPVRRVDGKIMKGPRYFKPRIKQILDATLSAPTGDKVK